MLILILVDVQYLKNVAFSFDQGLIMVQFLPPDKKSSKISHSGRWKTLVNAIKSEY